MIDPLLVPLTDWLFAGPAPESREQADGTEADLLRLIGSSTLPPEAVIPTPQESLQVQRCS